MPKQAPAEFVTWLTKKMEDKGWSARQTAQAAGISHTPISYIVNSGEQPSFDTCLGLARAFGVAPVEVLVRAGLLPIPSEWTPDREEWNAIFEALGDDDRENLLDLARIMRTRRKREERGANAKPKREPAR